MSNRARSLENLSQKLIFKSIQESEKPERDLVVIAVFYAVGSDIAVGDLF